MEEEDSAIRPSLDEKAKKLVEQLLAEEKVYTIAILLALYRKKLQKEKGEPVEDALLRSEIRKLIGKGRYLANRDYAESIVREMKDYGLILETKLARFKLIRLTKLGEKVAKLIYLAMKDSGII